MSKINEENKVTRDIIERAELDHRRRCVTIGRKLAETSDDNMKRLIFELFKGL